MANEPGQGPLARQLVLSLYVPAIMLALGTSIIAPVIPVFARSFGVSLSTAAFVFVATPLGAMVVRSRPVS